LEENGYQQETLLEKRYLDATQTQDFDDLPMKLEPESDNLTDTSNDLETNNLAKDLNESEMEIEVCVQDLENKPEMGNELDIEIGNPSEHSDDLENGLFVGHENLNPITNEMKKPDEYFVVSETARIFAHLFTKGYKEFNQNDQRKEISSNDLKFKPEMVADVIFNLPEEFLKIWRYEDELLISPVFQADDFIYFMLLFYKPRPMAIEYKKERLPILQSLGKTMLTELVKYFINPNGYVYF